MLTKDDDGLINEHEEIMRCKHVHAPQEKEFCILLLNRIQMENQVKNKKVYRGKMQNF